MRGDRRVPAAFAVLCVAGLVFDALHRSFWERGHRTAPVAAVLVLALLILLLRRHRFAWWIFVAFSGIGFVSWVANLAAHAVTVAWVVGGLLGVIEFALLVSPSMRRFVRLRGKLAPGLGRARPA